MTDPRHVFLALAGWDRADTGLCDGPARWRDPQRSLGGSHSTPEALHRALCDVLRDAGWEPAPADPRAEGLRWWRHRKSGHLARELDALDHLARVEPRPLHVAAYRAARAATLRVVAGGAADSAGSSERQTAAGDSDGGEGGSAA